MKKLFSVFTSLALVFGVTACGSSEQSKDNLDTDAIYNSVEASAITTLDSNNISDSVSATYSAGIHEGLVVLNPNTKEVDPGMAESWEDDGKGTVTFHLRKDAKWYDSKGAEVGSVTAKDFKFAFDRISKSEYTGDYINKYNKIKSWEATDDYTFVVKTDGNVPWLIEALTNYVFAPTNEELFKKAGGERQYGTTAEKTYSNGAYLLQKWDPTTEIVLVPNPKYWDADKVQVKGIQSRFVTSPEEQTLINMYLEGDIDGAGLRSPEKIAEYGERKDVAVKEGTSVFDLLLNLRPDRDSDMKYFREFLDGRKALQYGYDSNYFVDSIIGSGYSAPYWVPKGFATNPEDASKDFRTSSGAPEGYVSYDKDKALDYWNKFKEEVAAKYPGKTTFTLELMVDDSDLSGKLAEYVKQTLEANLPGLTMNIKMVPFQVKLVDAKNGDYDINFYGWGPDYPNANAMLDIFTSDSTQNESGYKNPKFDELIAKRDFNASIEAEKMLFDDAVLLPGYQRQSVLLRNPIFKTMNSNPFGASTQWKYVEVDQKLVKE